jgi:hypothetical protein
LNDIAFIKVDTSVKKEISNLDMIERYLEYFQKETLFYRYITEYHKSLLKKLEKKKTSVRSIRLALSPAVNFLKLCQQSNLTKLNSDALYAYLWSTTGQIASITGFISFLNKHYKLKLSPPKAIKLTLEKEIKSKKHLQQALIQLLRQPQLSNKEKHLLFELSIGYFHGIAIPKYTKATDSLINRSKSNNGYFKMCYISFYLPPFITSKL